MPRYRSSLRSLVARATVAISLLALPSVALAGDPCPIDFPIYDVGVAPWLERAEIMSGLESASSQVGIRYKSGDVGVVIQQVRPGSPAEKAGLKVGDVISAVEDNITFDRHETSAVFATYKPGQTVPLSVVRGDEVKMIDLTFGQGDPLIQAIFDQVQREESCADPHLVPISDEKREAAFEAAFSDLKRFQCDDAHTKMGDAFERDEIIIVRGSKRVLLAQKGWKTVCVKAKSYDGKKLNDKRVKALWEDLTNDYVADRHANP